MPVLIKQGISVQTCITSPPYFGQRSYLPEKHPLKSKEIGQESTPELYVKSLVKAFRLVWDLLADDGTLWLNLGDTYWGSWGSYGSRPEIDGKTINQRKKSAAYLPRGGWDSNNRQRPPQSRSHPFLKPKDLIGLPWMLAFALRADGWYLRQDLIWNKTTVLPEASKDRCTKAHEYIFLLSKSRTYYFNAAAIRDKTRNKRSVWTAENTNRNLGKHFSTFPPKLIEPCILAGSKPKDIVFDPFSGSGTVPQVAESLGRQWIGCEINESFLESKPKKL